MTTELKKIEQKELNKIFENRRFRTGGRVDLSLYDLTGLDLSLIYSTGGFKGVCLYRAKLVGADLVGADLSKADLQRANLQRANLERANLKEAYLFGADLAYSIVDKANLEGANLRGSSLNRASFFKTNLINANFSDCDLTGAIFDSVYTNSGTKWDRATFDSTVFSTI